MMNTENALLRRYEDDLNVSGAGVIIMGVWSVVRVLIEIFTNFKESMGMDGIDPTEDAVGAVVALVCIFVIFFIVMKIHLYVGLNAMRAAKGKEYKKGYLIAALIFGILTALSMITYVDSFKDVENIDTTFASMLVDLMTVYVFFIVIISTIKIRKLKEQSSQE